MPLSDVVQISVSSNTATPTQAGFGVPLVLSAEATFAERARSYVDIDGAIADSFAATGPTVLALTALFSQNPRPVRAIVGRLANKPTQRWTIDLGSAGILNSTRYRLQVVDALGHTLNADFTTDNTATEAELWVGMAAAFNALTGPTATAVNTGPNTSLVITGNAAGNWHGISVIDPNGQYDSGVYMSIVQDQADPGYAADLAAIKAVNNEWYAVCNPFNSELCVKAIAAYIEANNKLFVASIQDSATVTAVVGGTDTADDLKDSAYARTACIYHPDNAQFIAAAWLGRCLPLDPGSETWKFKTLAGVSTYPLTSTHQTNLEAKHCNYYYTVAGLNITTQGTVAGNEYIDVIRFIDWLQARMSERIFGRLVDASKIPYTAAGFAIIDAAMRAQLKEGVAVGGIAPNTISTTIPRPEDENSTDRGNRLANNFLFSGTLAGAIHKLIVRGRVTV